MSRRASVAHSEDDSRSLTPGERSPAGRLARAYAWTLLHLRWLVVPAWIAAAVSAVHFLPSLQQAQSGALGSLVPANAPALKAEERYPTALALAADVSFWDSDQLPPWRAASASAMV